MGRHQPYITGHRFIKWTYRRIIKPVIPFLFFAIGFYWQSLTLDRIDNIWINLVLLFDIIFLGYIIIIYNLIQYHKVGHPVLLKYKKWFPFVIQFMLGGLYSSYLIFYFQSSSFTRTLLFLILFVIFLFINQFFERELTHIYIQVAMYFIAVISFLIFFLPVVVGKMSLDMFITSGVISLIAVLFLLIFLKLRKAVKSNGEFFRSAGIVAVLYIIINVLYYANLIPPVPLSMKEGGIYKKVERIGNRFKLSGDGHIWYQIGLFSWPSIHFHKGDTVYCFVSIYAPTKLKKKVYHRWEHYDRFHRRWVTYDKIGYQVTGGRYGGYRGYTFKTNIFPGLWRVDVITEENRVLGRIPFRAIVIKSKK